MTAHDVPVCIAAATLISSVDDLQVLSTRARKGVKVEDIKVQVHLETLSLNTQETAQATCLSFSLQATISSCSPEQAILRGNIQHMYLADTSIVVL